MIMRRGFYELISKEGEMTIDSICRTTGIPVYKLSSLLLQMEFKGYLSVIREIFTKRFEGLLIVIK